MTGARNDDLAMDAARAMDTFAAGDSPALGPSAAGIMASLVTGLLHYADQHGIDFARVLAAGDAAYASQLSSGHGYDPDSGRSQPHADWSPAWPKPSSYSPRPPSSSSERWQPVLGRSDGCACPDSHVLAGCRPEMHRPSTMGSDRLASQAFQRKARSEALL